MSGAPAVAELGALTTNFATEPALTAIGPDVPLMLAVVVSVALMVCVPAVTRVAGNVPVPFVRVVFAGRVADGSVLVNAAVPE